MNQTSFIAFDVETATEDRASICQLGYARVENLEIIEVKSFLVQPPENRYNARNSNIHGLSALDTKNTPYFPQVWEQLKDDFVANILVAHNASFDSGALESAMELYNIEIPDLKYICTYQVTNLNLKSLCESLQIELTKHHNAENDAEACARAYIQILKGVEPDESLILPEAPHDPFAFEGHERLKGDILKPDLNVKDKNNPFYSKKVVLTGVLDSITRIEAATILKAKGADIDTGVTKRTNYVIAGHGAGPSKLKKIELYNEAGANIIIVTEEKFLNMIA